MTKMSQNPEKSIKLPWVIKLTGRIISFFSSRLAILYAAKLFTTPIKHKIPKRELEMHQNSVKNIIKIQGINKEIMLYQYGKSDKKILLVHGWSGRGTQLVKIAEELLKSGYSTISFDAPAHGKSPGKTTIMTDFIETILELEKQFGPFEAAIGHSLGGMSVLNATRKGLNINSLVIIGSGDIVQDVMDDFIAKINFKPETSHKLRLHVEKKYGEAMDDYSAYKSAKKIKTPTLIIHDENDTEVPVKAAIHIHQHLTNGELILTKGLGHRKILGNPIIIDKVVQFISNKNQT
jgi:pimeloyl-ACP methyl ester carboxylesterase